MKSLANPRDVDALRRRLQLVRADARRRWGTMSAHQMICHLYDAFIMGTDQQPVSDLTTTGSQTIVKWIALYLPVRWPQGIKTVPELDQVSGRGTTPSTFADDVTQLLAVMDAAATNPGFFESRRHPIFGPLSRPAWLRWGYLHVDHHLRQFGG